MMHDGKQSWAMSLSDFYCTESFNLWWKVRSLTQLGTTLSVGVIDLEDLILNYNQGTSGERVIGVKKRRIEEGVRTPLSFALYPSAHHDSSPLLEENVARRKRQTREVHAPRKEEQPQRRNGCMVCLGGQNQEQLQKKLLSLYQIWIRMADPLFNWSIVDLQCFRYISKWFRCIYILPFQILLL